MPTRPSPAPMPIVTPTSETASPSWSQQMNRAVVNNDLPTLMKLLSDLDQDPTLGDPNLPWDAPNAADPGTPLNVAIAHDRGTIAVVLARHPRVDVNVGNEYGVAPLFNAVAMSYDPKSQDLSDTASFSESLRMVMTGSPGNPTRVLDVVRTLLDAGAQAPAPMDLVFDLPLGLGRTLTLAERAAMDGGIDTPEVLDLLIERGMFDPTPEALARMLALATCRSLNLGDEDQALNITLKPSVRTLDWLLAHGAPTSHTDPVTGHGIMHLANSWRAQAPESFARLEQAVLRDEGNARENGLSAPTAYARPRL